MVAATTGSGRWCSRINFCAPNIVIMGIVVIGAVAYLSTCWCASETGRRSLEEA
jgi:hypothetical protein